MEQLLTYLTCSSGETKQRPAAYKSSWAYHYTWLISSVLHEHGTLLISWVASALRNTVEFISANPVWQKEDRLVSMVGILPNTQTILKMQGFPLPDPKMPRL